MAAVVQADVTILRRWEVGDRFGKHCEVLVDASFSLTAGGATAADIPATLFGLKTIHTVQTTRFTDGNSVVRLQPTFTDGTNIFTATVTTATDADRGIAENLTGTLVVRITGRP